MFWYMQTISAHGCMDQCVWAGTVFLCMKRYCSPSLAFLKCKQGYCHKSLGYQKGWRGWRDRLGGGKLKARCFLMFWEEPSPAVCRPKETKCLSAETVSPVWGTGQLPHLHQASFPPSSSVCDGNGNDEAIHKYQKNCCPNLNKNLLNLSPVCVSLKLGCIENSKCLAMSEFNYYLVGMKLCINANFRESQLLDGVLRAGWFSTFTLWREKFITEWKIEHTKNVQRYTTK